MAELSFELVSPEQLLLAVGAQQVNIPGTEGDFGVLPGHAPLIASVRAGVVSIEPTEGGERRIFVSGGLAEVSLDHLTLLADEAVPVEDLDRADLEQRLRNAEEDLADARDDTARERAEATLEKLREMLKAV